MVMAIIFYAVASLAPRLSQLIVFNRPICYQYKSPTGLKMVTGIVIGREMLDQY